MELTFAIARANINNEDVAYTAILSKGLGNRIKLSFLNPLGDLEFRTTIEGFNYYEVKNYVREQFEDSLPEPKVEYVLPEEGFNSFIDILDNKMPIIITLQVNDRLTVKMEYKVSNESGERNIAKYIFNNLTKACKKWMYQEFQEEPIWENKGGLYEE